jgi:hypothetical protein
MTQFPTAEIVTDKILGEEYSQISTEARVLSSIRYYLKLQAKKILFMRLVLKPIKLRLKTLLLIKFAVNI